MNFKNNSEWNELNELKCLLIFKELKANYFWEDLQKKLVQELSKSSGLSVETINAKVSNYKSIANSNNSSNVSEATKEIYTKYKNYSIRELRDIIYKLESKEDTIKSTFYVMRIKYEVYDFGSDYGPWFLNIIFFDEKLLYDVWRSIILDNIFDKDNDIVVTQHINYKNIEYTKVESDIFCIVADKNTILDAAKLSEKIGDGFVKIAIVDNSNNTLISSFGNKILEQFFSSYIFINKRVNKNLFFNNFISVIAQYFKNGKSAPLDYIEILNFLRHNSAYVNKEIHYFHFKKVYTNKDLIENLTQELKVNNIPINNISNILLTFNVNPNYSMIDISSKVNPLEDIINEEASLIFSVRADKKYSIEYIEVIGLFLLYK